MIFIDRLLTPTEVIELITEHKTSYYKIVKNHFPTLFEHVSRLPGHNLAERLYNYCYPGKHECLTCGSNKVRFQEFTTGYKLYCSPGCVSRSEKTKQGQEKFRNDPDKVKERTQKAKETSMKRYGVPYYIQTDEGRLRNSVANTKTYRSKFPHEVNGRSRKQYTAAVRHQTNLVYQEFKHILDPQGLRSREWVLDHVYSVVDGFTNEVPVNVLCHYSNLKLIKKTDNSSKNCRSDKTLEQLWEDYSDSE